MVQAPVTIPALTFPVHVNNQNLIPVPQGGYNTHACKYYPNGVFNVTRAQGRRGTDESV